MAEYTYIKLQGIGPIKFGMSSEDVQSILGEPKQKLSFAGGNTGELGEVIKEADLEGVTSHLAEMYSGQSTDIFNNGELDDYNGSAKNDLFSEITYFQGKVAKITSLDCRHKIYFENINLCEENIEGVVRKLFVLDQNNFISDTHFYFKNLGVSISYDKDRQKSIELLTGETEDSAFEYEEYEEISLEELEDFFAD